jgi:hypothetical protein
LAYASTVIGIRRGIPLRVEISQGLVVGGGGLLSTVAEGLDIAERFVRIPDGLSTHDGSTLKLVIARIERSETWNQALDRSGLRKRFDAPAGLNDAA